jgi:group I intron endonuclease
MSADCGVYAWLNTRTGKVYVGSSVNVLRRYKEHLSMFLKGSHYNRHLQNAWNIDSQCFAFAVIELSSVNDIRERGRFWLDELQAGDKDLGYNLMSVRDGVFVHGLETRARLSTSSTGRIVSPETRARISATQAGKIISMETRIKISAARRGKPSNRKGKTLSKEHRTRISAWNKGKTLSQADKDRKRVARIANRDRKIREWYKEAQNV